jgi:hypothetical protein
VHPGTDDETAPPVTLDEMARLIAGLEARLETIERQLAAIRDVLSRWVIIPPGRSASPRRDR